MAPTLWPKLGIQSLCDKAPEDIKSKLTSENVVGEVFSWVTAGWVPWFLQLWEVPVRANIFVQSKSDHGDAMRPPYFGLQRPNNSCAREREHQAHI